MSRFVARYFLGDSFEFCLPQGRLGHQGRHRRIWAFGTLIQRVVRLPKRMPPGPFFAKAMEIAGQWFPRGWLGFVFVQGKSHKATCIQNMCSIAWQFVCFWMVECYYACKIMVKWKMGCLQRRDFPLNHDDGRVIDRKPAHPSMFNQTTTLRSETAKWA